MITASRRIINRHSALGVLSSRTPACRVSVGDFGPQPQSRRSCARPAMFGVRCRSPSSRGAFDRGPVGDDQRLLRVGNRSRRVVRRCTVECEQTSAACNARQRARSRKVNLNERTERTRPEPSNMYERFSRPSDGSINAPCVPDGKSIRRPSRNCPTIICAQAPSRPEGRAHARAERSAAPCTVPSTDAASSS